MFFKYAVVRFRGGEESVEVVPTSWICEDQVSCKWPPKTFNNEKIRRLIMSLSKPTPEFDIYPVTVMHEYGMHVIIYAFLYRTSQKFEIIDKNINEEHLSE